MSVVCIGAGPAGLTAAYMLSKEGVPVTVLEQDPDYVGGISRTVTYKGFAFDIGGHRFFSKSKEIENLWTELLGDDFLERPRKSRIYYRRKLFDYPLRAFDALKKLGPFEAAWCVLSYANARLHPVANPRNFSEWVINKFGRRLFEIFFRTYTEKVWGMRCEEISADWAAQRIKGLSLSKAVLNALRPQKRSAPGEQTVKTLVASFRYPRRGPGMLWEAAAARVRANGGTVRLGQTVIGLERTADGAWAVRTRDRAGAEHVFSGQHVISSMPMRDLSRAVAPPMPPPAAQAAQMLRYRDFILVALVVRERNLFNDNWIYVHEPGVKVGRIQNFKSWSPEMVPGQDVNCYGMEYFCFDGDGLWNSADADLLQLATGELIQLGLARPGDMLDGTVVRQPKAYPVYDDRYLEYVTILRDEVEKNYPNLHLVGRNGMHKYNNQDHAMMTAILTARNILAGRQVYDVWRVNEDAEYHEEGAAGVHDDLTADAPTHIRGRLVPMRVA